MVRVKVLRQREMYPTPTPTPHQIEQLKEEIDAKDQAFVKEHIEHNKADKEKDALKNDLVRER